MKVVICDRCGQELQNKRKAVYERYETVSLSPQERIDLCQACYPFWDKLHRRLVQTAEDGIESIERQEKALLAEFWQPGVTNGIAQDTETNRPPAGSPPRR